MQILLELTELLFVVIPIAIVGISNLRPAVTISQWTYRVIATSASALFSMGIALMRLTGQCAPHTSCAEGFVALPRQPGFFKSCHVCVTSATPGIASFLNSWLIELQCGSAVLCLIGSMTTLARFVLWTRKRFN